MDSPVYTQDTTVIHIHTRGCMQHVVDCSVRCGEKHSEMAITMQIVHVWVFVVYALLATWTQMLGSERNVKSSYEKYMFICKFP